MITISEKISYYAFTLLWEFPSLFEKMNSAKAYDLAMYYAYEFDYEGYDLFNHSLAECLEEFICNKKLLDK